MSTQKSRLPIIVPRKRSTQEPPVVLQVVTPTIQGQQEDIKLEESMDIPLMPDTEEEIEFRKRKYPTISLGKRLSGTASSCKNKIIIEHLRRLVEHIENQIRSSGLPEDRKKHGFRLSSIRKGIQLIQEYPEEITSGRQARQIKGIGKGISDRIDEILRDESLAELEEDMGQGEDSNRIIAELTTVSGIGVVKARELMVKYELEGVEDLIQRWQAGLIKVGRHELTHHIEVGLRWYHDTKQKIPRNEMDVYSTVLEEVARSIDKDLKTQICGSYRRGKSQSSDVDVLLTHPNLRTEPEVTVSKIKYLPMLLEALVDRKIIVDSMTDHHKSSTKYMGVSRIKEDAHMRRIDIRFVAYESWATALYYFTGSGTFNKLFRGIALQRGYTLNEYGIYKLNEKGERGELIPTFSEEQIFDVVGVEYLTPGEREF